MQDEQVGEAARDDICRSPVHAPDAEQSDLAEDRTLSERDDDFPAVDATEDLNLA